MWNLKKEKNWTHRVKMWLLGLRVGRNREMLVKGTDCYLTYFLKYDNYKMVSEKHMN